MMSLPEKIKSFPRKSGIYWMKDSADTVIYVGKAKDLRARIRAYFGNLVGTNQVTEKRPQITFLMRRTKTVEFLVTDNEKEALLLENTLIKKHQPRYNIQLRDDKNYASIKLTLQHPFPGLYITRNIVKDGAEYFGPHTSATALRGSADFLVKNFRLRTCSDHEFANRSRPCLQYDIGRCSAPCVGKVSSEEYGEQVAEVRLFLTGKQKELVQILKARMKSASEKLDYERAARLRDLIAHMQATLEKQKVIHHEARDYDAIGLVKNDQRACVCLLVVRAGSLIDRHHFFFQNPLEEEAEILRHFLLQYYGPVLYPPSEILLPVSFEGTSSVAEILGERGGAVVVLTLPKRGEKAKLVKMAVENARNLLQTERQREDVLVILQNKLGLESLPHRIECVDISNFQGKEAVGSLVCFEEGKPNKNRYRRFKIRQPEEPNDYAMMDEVLRRRFQHEEWGLPDLLLVDGGKGQLAIAQKVLADLGLHQLPAIAIAKGKAKGESDKIFIPGRMNPLPFHAGSPELHLLMRLRDEAHRFAITYHRNLVKKGLF